MRMSSSSSYVRLVNIRATRLAVSMTLSYYDILSTVANIMAFAFDGTGRPVGLNIS